MLLIPDLFEGLDTGFHYAATSVWTDIEQEVGTPTAHLFHEA